MQELDDQIANTSLEIVAIQEIRWKGNGIINKKNYSLYYSGSTLKSGQASTGFCVKKQYTIMF
jgi:hypothetical protein